MNALSKIKHNPKVDPSFVELVPAIVGTQDWHPEELARLQLIEDQILDQFRAAGYRPIRTPILEYTELPERKSGAGIATHLYEVASDQLAGRRLCLRPELTAGIVRAYAEVEPVPVGPWRVSHVGSAFRHAEPEPGQSYREFRQVGVELLGQGGAAYDGELIWLADRSVRRVGLESTQIRLGHSGLTRELFDGVDLPPATRRALGDMLSLAAIDDPASSNLESILERFTTWLKQVVPDPATMPMPPVESAGDPELDRLFRTLVPRVIGRRSGHEVLMRMRSKWDLRYSLFHQIEALQPRLHRLAELRGPAGQVMDQLRSEFADVAPRAISHLAALLDAVRDYGLDLDRVVLDPLFDRGLSFYNGMLFAIQVETQSGRYEICGGGRYDGLARSLGSDRNDQGAGFAIGLERMWDTLKSQDRLPHLDGPPKGLLVLPGTEAVESRAIQRSVSLREQGHQVVLQVSTDLVLAKHLARQHRLAAIVIVDDHEADERILDPNEGCVINQLPEPEARSISGGGLP